MEFFNSRVQKADNMLDVLELMMQGNDCGIAIPVRPLSIKRLGGA